jgi:hypothetical protein
MAASKRPPEVVYKISKELAERERPLIERYSRAKKVDVAPRGLARLQASELGGLQADLYVIALQQLRWGFDGLRETMDKLDNLLPLFDEAYTDLGEPWYPWHCRLDAHLRLNYLLDRQALAPDYVRKWAEGADEDPNYNCTHQCEVALEIALTEGKNVEMPCAYSNAKKFLSLAQTYKCYFDFIAAIVGGNTELAAEKANEGVKLYKRRARGASGPRYYAYGFQNAYLFDFELAAILEFARRTRGWDLPTDEAHGAALMNAAAFREQHRVK